MTNLRISTALLLATTSLVGCDARFQDVSSETTHQPYIGQICTLDVNMRAHGVARDVKRDKKTDFVSIWNPGFTGPEMTFLIILEPGTRLRILAAQSCINCLFDRLTEYQVEVNPEPSQFSGKPAYLRADSKSEQFMRCAKPNAT
jgi:hypothetical protein